MKFRTVLLATVISMGAMAMASAAEQPASSGSLSSGAASAQKVNLTSDQESKIKSWWASQNKGSSSAASATTTASSSMSAGSTVPSSTQLQSFPADLGVKDVQYVQNGNQLCLVNQSNRTIDRCMQ